MLFLCVEIRYLDYRHPRQMPDCRHHDPEVEGKLVGATLLEELPLKEHAGPLAELNDRAIHAFLAERKMRRGVERDGVKVSHMTNLMHALSSGVLTGHDIPKQIDRDGVGALHGKLLVAGLDGKPLDLKNEPAAFQSV